MTHFRPQPVLQRACLVRLRLASLRAQVPAETWLRFDGSYTIWSPASAAAVGLGAST